MKLRNVVLVDGARSAFGRGAVGSLVATRLDEAGAKVIKGLLDKNPKVKPSMIEDLGLGNVGGGFEFTFLGVVGRLAGLPMETCNFVTDRQCGSSMDTLHQIARSIMTGSIDCGLALGIERMGRGLMMPTGEKQTRVNSFNPNIMQMTKEQRDMAPDHFDYFSKAIPESVLDLPPVMPMVQTAQNVAEMYALSRQELDEYAAKSHQKTAAAYEKGVYKDEIIPLEVEKPVIDGDKNWVEAETGETFTFDRDDCIRPDTTAEKLAGLNPIKGLLSPGQQDIVITPGNACPTNDGISAALLMSEEKAIELGLEPLARIVAMNTGGVKPQIMGVGPVVSTKKALQYAGIEAEQIDRVEFNEAFAAQVIPSYLDLNISEDKINVNGGSIAIGHPLGATGARLVTTVAKELRRSSGQYGLATQCIGAGMGISTIIQAMN